jgi:hypothetical protein
MEEKTSRNRRNVHHQPELSAQSRSSGLVLVRIDVGEAGKFRKRAILVIL